MTPSGRGAWLSVFAFSLVACGGEAPQSVAKVASSAPVAPVAPEAPKTPFFVVDGAPGTAFTLFGDGRLLASWGRDHRLDIEDTSGRTLASVNDLGNITGVYIASVPVRGFVVLRDHEADLFDLVGPKLVFAIPFPKSSPRAVSDDDGSHLLFEGDGGEPAKVVDLSTLEITPLPGTEEMAFYGIGANGKRAIFAQKKPKEALIVYDVEAGQVLLTRDWEQPVQLSRDGRVVRVGQKLVELSAPRRELDFAGAVDSGANAFAVSPTGARFLGIDKDHKPVVFEIGKSTVHVGEAMTNEARWTGDGRVAVLESDKHVLRAYPSSGGPSAEIATVPNGGHAFTRGGDRLVLWEDKAPIRLLDARSGAVVAETKETEYWRHCSQASRDDGTPVVMCETSMNRSPVVYDFSRAPIEPTRLRAESSRVPSWTVNHENLRLRCPIGEVIWDVTKDTQIFHFTSSASTITDLGYYVVRAGAFGVPFQIKGPAGDVLETKNEPILQQDGKLAATVDGDHAEILDLEQRARAGHVEIAKQRIGTVLLHPSEPWLLANGDKTRELFDLSDPVHPKRVGTVDFGSTFFAPKGPYFFVATSRLHFLNAKTGLTSHTLAANFTKDGLAWSPDGTRVVILDVGSETDMPVRPPAAFVVDAATGVPVAKLPIQRFARARWSSDGATITIASDEKEASILVDFDAKSFAKIGEHRFEKKGDSPKATWIKPSVLAFVALNDNRAELRSGDGKAALPLAYGVSSGESPRCGLFVHDGDHFDGDPTGAARVRLGEDLRTADVVEEGPLFEAHRAPLVAALMAPSAAK